MQWNKKQVDCLQSCLRQVQNQEQTQELRLTDDMPEIGSVLCAWGQPIIRSKEWRSDCMVVSGGVQAVVLYSPENGAEPQSAECWLPFQAKWNFPESKREGVMHTQCRLRSVDARLLSSRKLMVRASVAVLAEAVVADTVSVYTPENREADVQLLENTYPLTLPKEAGEKIFLLDEEQEAPGDMEKMVAWDVEPRVQEENVVGDKAVIKGEARVHLVYMGKDGKLHSRYFPLPFAQYAELDRDYDKDATMTTVMAVSSLEPELTESNLRIKCGLVAQYMICELEYLTLAEDAYSLGRELEMEMELLTLPVVLDRQRRAVDADMAADTQMTQIVDVCFLPGYPVQYHEDREQVMELAGSFQLLGYDTEGNLCSQVEDWTDKIRIPADGKCGLWVDMDQPTGAAAHVSGEKAELSAQLCLQLQAVCAQEIPMLTGVEPGSETQPDPQRPSLIVKRMTEESLWQLAKECGSTVEAIRRANQLQTDPLPGQMLLIPVC